MMEPWAAQVRHMAVVLTAVAGVLAAAGFEHSVHAKVPAGLSTPSQTYVVGPNDELYIVVTNEDDLTTQVKVSAEGKIAFPLLATVGVGGLTIQQVEERITGLLADGYLRHPQVMVYVVHYRDIYVTGGVKNPGEYPYRDGLTVLKAISIAGGLSDEAVDSVVLITRGSVEDHEPIKAKMDDVVQPGDQIDVSSVLTAR